MNTRIETITPELRERCRLMATRVGMTAGSIGVCGSDYIANELQEPAALLRELAGFTPDGKYLLPPAELVADPDAAPKNIVITVKYKNVMTPQFFKTRDFNYIPTVDQLRWIGANIHPERGDEVSIEEVSSLLHDSINATWVRDDSRPGNWANGEVPAYIRTREALKANGKMTEQSIADAAGLSLSEAQLVLGVMADIKNYVVQDGEYWSMAPHSPSPDLVVPLA